MLTQLTGAHAAGCRHDCDHASKYLRNVLDPMHSKNQVNIVW